MTDALDVLIQSALLGALTVPPLTSPATPIAYPMVGFTPTGGVAYIQVWPLLKSQTQHPAIGFVGSNLNRGIFQVDAVIPDGEGEAPGMRLAALVAARYALGTVLAAGPYKLEIKLPVQSSAGVKDEDWVRYAISVPYLVITPN